MIGKIFVRLWESCTTVAGSENSEPTFGVFFGNDGVCDAIIGSIPDSYLRHAIFRMYSANELAQCCELARMSSFFFPKADLGHARALR